MWHLIGGVRRKGFTLLGELREKEFVINKLINHMNSYKTYIPSHITSPGCWCRGPRAAPPDYSGECRNPSQSDKEFAASD